MRSFVKTAAISFGAVILTAGSSGVAAGAQPNGSATVGSHLQPSTSTATNPATAAQAPANRFSLVTHNIQGGQRHAGGPGAVSPIRNWATGSSADAIALQEVCHSQALEIINNGISGYTPVYWHPTRTNGACGADNRIGEFILVNSAHPVGQFTLHPIGPEAVLTCADFSFKNIPVRACSTHLPLGVTATTTANLRAEVNGMIASGLGVAIGGDFNKEPNTAVMANVYKIANGNLNEADQLSCGSPCRSGTATHFSPYNGSTCGTIRRKIDYVFFSDRLSNTNAGLSTWHREWCPNFSDHKVYHGLSANFG